MTNGKTVLESVIPAVSKSNGDYYGKDGLLYCGKCHTPKEAFFAKNFVLMVKNRHPVDCRCRKMEREQQEVAIRQQKHSELVRRLKAGGFSDTAMLDWNFENDDGRAPQMHYAHRYVEHAYREPRTTPLGRCGHRQEFPCRVHYKRSNGTGSVCAYDELCPHHE